MSSTQGEDQQLLCSQTTTREDEVAVPSSARVNLLESISAATPTWNWPTATSIWQSHQKSPVIGRWGRKGTREESCREPTALRWRTTLNEPTQERPCWTGANKNLWAVCMYRDKKKVRSADFASLWTNYKWMICTRDWKRLDLESHMLPMSISGLFNYCNAVASPLHLAGQINGLHWSTYL